MENNTREIGNATEWKMSVSLPCIPEDKDDKRRSAASSPIGAPAQSTSLASSSAPVSQYAIIVNPVQVSLRVYTEVLKLIVFYSHFF